MKKYLKNISLTFVVIAMALGFNFVSQIKAEDNTNNSENPIEITGYEKEYDGKFFGLTINGRTEDDNLEFKKQLDDGSWESFDGDSMTFGNVGEIIIKVEVENENYLTKVIETAIKITPKPVTITVNDAEKIYGEGDPIFTGTVEGVLEASAIYNIEYKRSDNEKDAGVYANTITASHKHNANYDVTIRNGDFTIHKKAATITVDDAEKVYWENDPIFTGTVDGLLAGDTISDLEYERENSDNDVGFYKDVLTATYTDNPNYDLAVEKGDFRIHAPEIIEEVYYFYGYMRMIEFPLERGNMTDDEWAVASQPIDIPGFDFVETKMVDDEAEYELYTDHYYEPIVQEVTIVVGETETIDVDSLCYQIFETDDKYYWPGNWDVEDPLIAGIISQIPSESNDKYTLELEGKTVGNTRIGLFSDAESEEYNPCMEIVINVIPKETLKGDVVVTYEDTKGNQLDNVTLNGDVGNAWTSDQKEFEGYTFKEVIGDTSGTFTEDDQTVAYVYNKSIPWTKIETSTTIETKDEFEVKSAVKPEVKTNIPETGITTGAALYTSTLLVSLGGLYIFSRKKEKKK